MKISPDGSTQTASPIEEQRQAKLIDSSQQFEATMLLELLKPLQHGQDGWDSAERSDDVASDTISSFGAEAIAKTISKHGGFGMAKQIVAKVTLENQRISEKKTSGY
jgi:peptidoglycan hydrolase FlgJ